VLTGTGDAEASYDFPMPIDLGPVVRALRQSRERLHNVRPLGGVRELPSRAVMAQILGRLSAALFPTHFAGRDLTDENIDDFVQTALTDAFEPLVEQVRRGLRFAPADERVAEPELAGRAREIAASFAGELPAIRGLLVSDLHAAVAGDPAATGTSEVLLCYPGFLAVMYYRFAHALRLLGAPLIPRMMTEIGKERTGIDIHPGATIAGSFFIDHGTGVVIGETSIIGERVRLYQAVTLGAKRFAVDESGQLVKGVPRHPIVEDDVVIYAGATVLGRITIGKGATIGGNVWVTQDVAPGASLTQAQMRTGGPA
jgi:serine O-acetyltransferase